MTPHQWLMATPRGAYTTVLVREGRQLLNWDKHVERLQKSIRALHTSLEGFFEPYHSFLEDSQACEATLLRQLLGPPILAALQQAQEAEAAVQDLMLMIVMVPQAEAPGLDVRVRAFPCGSAGSSPPGSAVILGGPRSIPVGKDSGWVADRQPLEQQRGEAVEVLLSSEDGRLLEGLVTNVFVVTAGDSTSGAGAAPVVWTAGMGDGVVWGTVRASVLEACRQLGIAVREEAPAVNARHTWREAFLTNGLRLVQPLTSISCGAANVWGHQPWTLDLGSAPGPVTAALTAAVLPLLPAVDAAEL